MVLRLSSLEKLEKVLQEAGDQPVLVDFYATWCLGCQKMAPIFEKLAKTYSDMLVYKIAVDEAEGVEEKYIDQGYPTFKVFRNGQEIESQYGPKEEQLEELFKKYCSQ